MNFHTASSSRRPIERRARSALLLAAVIVAFIALALLVPGCSGGSNALEQAARAEAAGDYKSAISHYQARLQEDPDDLTAIKGLAVDLFITGDFDGALPYQEKAVAADPKDAQIRVELGFNYLNHQGQPAKAVKVFEEAAALEPSGKNLSFLAQSQLAVDDAAGAEQTLRRAISLEPGYGRVYSQLIDLLESQGRTAEAEQVRSDAAEAGAKI